MKLSTLEKFIQDENDVAQIFNELDVDNTKRYERMEFPLTQRDVTAIGQRIAFELSPEVLHADGERSAHDVYASSKYWNQLYRELKQYVLDNDKEVQDIWALH
jgi:hypothetical protein|tara:strand:+ start:237 stop:545 length:309 start_codon:yes stop_codon:yes gene_type:complete